MKYFAALAILFLASCASRNSLYENALRDLAPINQNGELGKSVASEFQERHYSALANSQPIETNDKIFQDALLESIQEPVSESDSKIIEALTNLKPLTDSGE